MFGFRFAKGMAVSLATLGMMMPQARLLADAPQTKAPIQKNAQVNRIPDLILTDGGTMTGDAGTGDAAPASKKVGAVTIGQAKVTVAASTVFVTSFAATFTDGAPIVNTPGTCTTTAYGACSFTECTSSRM